MDTTARPSSDVSHDQRNLAALSYVWILSIAVFLAHRDDEFVGPHARQGLLLFIFSIIAWFIPYAGYVLEIVLGTIMVMGYVRASQGQAFALPLRTVDVSRFATRMNLEWDRLWKNSNPLSATAPDGNSRDASDHENQSAAFAYLWIVSVIMADNAGDCETLRFHARQGVTIFLLSVIAATLGTFGTYLQIVLLVASVAGFLSALLGRKTPLPLIYGISIRLPTLDAAWQTVTRKIAATFPGLKMGTLQGKLDTSSPDERERTLGLLSYVLLSPVFLVFGNVSEFVAFHARQGLLLNAALIGLYAFYPTAYSGLAILVALTILGASRAHRGIRSPIPVVSEAAEVLAKLFTRMKHHADAPLSSIRPEEPSQEGLHRG